MTGKTWVVTTIACASLALAPRASNAQPIIVLPDHPAISASVGIAGNGDQDSRDSARDVSIWAEVPYTPPYRVRLSGGRAAWTFNNGNDQPPQLAERVSVTRGTISLMKMVVPELVGSPGGAFVGVGFGFYHYAVERGRGASATRAGWHVLGGFEYRLARERVVLDWEAQLHAANGPISRDIASQALWVLQASVGVKYRF